jgi:ectoine hydroxylase-related dioxygenase (phytanoyl-CoA dioxygenase family)
MRNKRRRFRRHDPSPGANFHHVAAGAVPRAPGSPIDSPGRQASNFRKRRRERPAIRHKDRAKAQREQPVSAGLKLAEAGERDLAEAKRALDENGYCILPDVLESTVLAQIRERIEAQAEAERALGLTVEGGPEGPNQRVFMLVNKGQVFVDLITHPLAMQLARHVLGGAFLLSQFSANIARFGGVEQGLHCDDWWAPRPIAREGPFTRIGDLERYSYRDDPHAPPRALITPPCVLNFAWMVSDFTVDNGGTRLAPGSHLSGVTPDGSVPHKVATIAAEGKAGSLLAFDGRVWHGTGRNVTEAPRIGLLMTFCGPQFRTQENFFIGLDPKVYAAASDRLRELLGFRIWNAYGRTEIQPHGASVAPGQGSFPAVSLREPWRR